MLIKAKTIQVQTAEKVQLFDLTTEVRGFLAESGVWNGMGVVSTLHTTTGVFFTEVQDALWDDVSAFLRQLVAERAGYKHNNPRFSDCDRQNAAAHLRSILLGSSLALQVEDGWLVLGQFQRIVFAELDGPRPRSLRIQFMGEEAALELSNWDKTGSQQRPVNGGLR
ncbi:MAG TPA: secondary thiamine-phosphate synthase enzyme YjbQ [Candidatus Binatia bacterium]|nr:secondary thiamine-phosphate synthase enzyme YjbQ [Candidatus Binatia bacterium]